MEVVVEALAVSEVHESRLVPTVIIMIFIFDDN